MNQTFSINRLGLLLKLHLIEHLKSYLLGAGLLFGLLLALLLPNATRISVFSTNVYQNHALLFGVFFCGASAWFASELFRVVSGPLRGIPYLMLPASQLEKFLEAFLMLLLFVPIFLGVFYTAEGICFSIINARLPASSPRYELLNPVGPYMDPFLGYLTYITPFFFLVGSMYFPKLPFVKTGALAITLLIVTVAFVNDFIIDLLFPARDYYGSTLFREVNFTQDGRWYSVGLTGTPKLIINSILALMIPALWYIAYVRFKEKEL
ncbi:hypothetical protein LX87_05250 [Larkinella arboricola]|uniref:ABC-2 type transport system permease protein n=1 Tax=Larkinella arboricola TaxID=643671 RepID=A0A327WLM9_LARAB|nr:hypothetical protein [Larkinella arboricola]RAJ92281.1 hypothetical protein LX87_05250 [Larkinella arboricola]